MGISVKNGGVWQPGIPYVRHAGVWKIPRAYVKQSGVWVPAYALQPLSRTLADLKLSTNLKLCLDAGDIVSLPAASTKWLDTSGNGYDFFRGTSAGAEGSDPAIVGTAGGLSSGEYLSFDGGDYLTYDATNEAWMQNYHKASAKLTFAMWAYLGAGAIGNNVRLAGTRGNSSPTGFSFQKGSGDNFGLGVINAGTNVLNASVAQNSTVMAAGQWYFLAMSLDAAIGANGGIAMVNGSQELFNSTYTSPASGNASQTMQIGAGGAAFSPLASGSRIGQVSMWEAVALSTDELTALFQATRDRYGI